MRIDFTHPSVRKLFPVTATGPVDVCVECFETGVYQSGVFLSPRAMKNLETEHPPYEDSEYQCYFCGAPLFAFDNDNDEPY